MNDFFVGARYLVDGFSIIAKPNIRRFVIVPFMVNIILFIGLFLLLQHFMRSFNVWFLHYLPAWLHFFEVILWVFFFIGFFLIFIYTFVTIANLLAAPFNSLLSEAVEYDLTGKTHLSRSFMENLRDVPRIVARQVSLIGLYLLPAIVICICFFIPIIHALAIVLWFLFNAWFMSLTYLDYPTDNHRIAMRDVRQWLNGNRSLGFGFGIATLLATMMPVINFFAIPAAVAGATKLWIKKGDDKCD